MGSLQGKMVCLKIGLSKVLGVGLFHSKTTGVGQTGK